MSDVTSNLPSLYNFTFKSALYSDTRSITGMPEIGSTNLGFDYTNSNDTQNVGTFVINKDTYSDGIFINAVFYEDKIELSSLADDYVLVYK